MEMQPTPFFRPGSPEATAALQRFKTYAMSHTLLAEVDKQLSRAIHEPAGFAFVLLYGPSGVGKTTLIRQLEHRAGVVREPTFPGLVGGSRHPHPFAPVPLLLLETRPPDGATFNRAEYYEVALKQLGEYPYDPSWEQKKGRGKDAKFNDSAKLRQIYEAALQRRGVRTIILDEAQHLLKLASGVKMIDQLDWLKSMTNTTGALHILTGTYELLPLRNLNGQAARRGLEIHFPRYQFQHEPDQLAFQRTLLTLLQQIPLKVEIKPLVDQWSYFYERCIGCIGVLKDWLVRALAASLAAGQSELLLGRIQECALPIAQCESMALEAAAGEQELHYTASRQQHLWALLGMKMGEDMTRKPVQPIPEEHMQPQPEEATTNQRSRVGEQWPVRLEVGEPQDKGNAEHCPFSGTVVELQSVQIRATNVERLQCPTCGAARKATVRGDEVIYSPHTPLRIARANKGPLWIRQGTTWAIQR
ncbi:ATP-binding protein [Dictyobacter alpinus]|uniref:ATP-binding protein n=1 Tax=Dictyobacter alpinus TaxID=2014873 RepID=A0A402BDG2_9CHLR|nr:ATP-binding protein [Dictyobacter alpinus]GCE29332.1 ATP-binding protein [Dictyobacter alpinus]